MKIASEPPPVCTIGFFARSVIAAVGSTMLRAERTQEEVGALVELALDQRGGARRIAGVVEQFQLDLVLLAGDLDAAQHVVEVAGGGDVAVVDVEPGLRRARR
mgnify:CR=1 FL=1